MLLAHFEERDRAWLLAHPEDAVSEPAALERALARRAAGEPIAYIRGFKEWRSLRIKTDPRALIPRPETELLADAAIREVAATLAQTDVPVVAWEVATGSGAVAVVLALEFREALQSGRLTLIATDLSPDAAELAAENVAAHGVGGSVNLEGGDLLEAAGARLPRPDVIIANLPYVATAEVDTAAGSLAHEPRLALDGGPDGLDIIRRLLDEVPTRAAPAATVLLEIGTDQAAVVRALAPAGASVSFEADLAGIPRVVRIGLSDSNA
ncbi:MAG: peptide chain release factor N(5)-glutamine methyltransferase [Chloroflexi bacterium]|nr:peptide chain release factor N(5)-glutamine methyltransferase [Chloroflexota bacterium]